MTYFSHGDRIEIWEGTDLGAFVRLLREAEPCDPDVGAPGSAHLDGVDYFAAALFREPQPDGTSLHKVLMLRRKPAEL